MDPSNPSYSELPGSANTTNTPWIVLRVISVLMLFGVVLATRRTIRLFRQRRAARGLTYSGNTPVGF